MRIVKGSLNAEVWSPELTTYVSSLTVELSFETIEVTITLDHELPREYLQEALKRNIMRKIEEKLFGDWK